ncbi:peptidoglycan-binding protein [Bacillus weihaiensis]|uniref:peptidoglycan-binding protein n=1 Tax=Bacillus weihaiensis TaxID=1547283 RepID=UPI0023564C31|nr:peptidoglycan-binding protein [Bacillus weihaiensis]
MSVEKLKQEAIERMGSRMQPIVKEKVLDIIEKAYAEGIYVLITSGYRSVAEQNKLFAKGRTTAQLRALGVYGVEGKPNEDKVTNAIGSQSNHTKGIAVDYCLTNKTATEDYWVVNSDWKRVAAIAKSMGFAWGGDWKGFVDNPHLEYTGKITVSPEETKVDSVIVTKPSTGADANIKKFQTFLNGYTKKANFKALVVDGYSGPKTKTAAIRVFQYFAEVSIDGIFGKKSKAACPVVVPGTSWSKWTRLVQGMLYFHKYDAKGFDGIYGNGCKIAVESFQEAKGITADGEAGPNTFTKFFA